MPKAGYSVNFNKQIKDYNGSIYVDTDKSLSIRSILLGSICEGVSQIDNLLESEDVSSSINFVKSLGVKLHLEDGFQSKAY